MIYLPTRFISTTPTVIQQHAALYLSGTSNVTEDISTLHNNNGSAAISSYSKTQTVGVPAAHEGAAGGGAGLSGIQVPITLSTLTNVSSTSAKAKYSDVQSSTAAIKTVNNGGGASNVAVESKSNIQSMLPDNTIHGVLASSIYEAGHTDSNPELCPKLGTNIHLLALVMSAPNHFTARQAIRQTWGHYAMRRDVAIGFLLGATQNDKKLEFDLNVEQQLYGDLIRGRFIDTYNNLTLKTISMLEWVDNFCPKTKFVLKTDDDMFININKLLMFINKHTTAGACKPMIYGRLAKKWKPIRNAKSKYYVSLQQYSSAVFPDFTTGPAYLMTTCSVHDLYEAALNHTYLKLEDVFTTGIVAHQLGIKRVHAYEFLNKRIAFNPCNIQKAISIHMVKYNEQFDLWKKLLDGKTKCK